MQQLPAHYQNAVIHKAKNVMAQAQRAQIIIQTAPHQMAANASSNAKKVAQVEIITGIVIAQCMLLTQAPLQASRRQ